MLTTLVFATLAGTLSILSPCTLPILPLVVAGSYLAGRDNKAVAPRETSAS
jgi:cytochrome c biogenesis protein CcdA